MPSLGVLLERSEKLVNVWLEDLLAGAALEVIEQGSAASNPSEIDESRGGSNVLAGESKSLIHAPDCMADVDP